MKQGRMSVVLALCLAACGIPRIAQAQASSDPSFGDVIEVNVVNVDVHVTDRNGRAVTDLRREDFEVLEDGKRVEVTNFRSPDATKAAAEAVPAPAGAPGAAAALEAPVPEDLLHLIVYVDNFNLRPEHRARVLHQLREVLKTLRPQDRVMLATNDFDLKVRLPFTNDPAAIATALSAIETLPAQGVESDMERRSSIMRVLEIREAVREWDGPCSLQIVAPAESYAEATRQEALRSIGVMTALVSSLSGVPGRKALLHVSNGIPVTPGEEVYQLLAEICGGGTTSGIEDVHDPELEDQAGLQYNGRQAALDAQRYSVARELAKLANHASSNRVILYTLQAGGPASGTAASADHGGMERLAQLPSLQFVQTTNLQSSLNMLASETGGRAILNAAEIRDDLRQIQADLDTFYSLGYMPEHFGDGREHRVEVKVRRPGLQVRYRKTYRDKSSLERAFDRTLAALYHGYEDNPLDVALTVGRQSPADTTDRFLVPLKLRIPLFRLGIGTVGEGQSYSGRLKLLVSTRDAQGGVSPMRQVEVPLTIPREEILMAMGKFYEYELTLNLKKGEQHVAIAVRDESTATTSFLSRTVSVGAAGSPDGAAAAR